MIGQVLRERLAGTDLAMFKSFHYPLVDEIVLDGLGLRIKGCYTVPAEAMGNVKMCT